MELKDSAKFERKAYYKKWRAENKDKVAKYNKNYWEKRALKVNGIKQNLEIVKKFLDENKEDFEKFCSNE